MIIIMIIIIIIIITIISVLHEHNNTLFSQPAGHGAPAFRALARQLAARPSQGPGKLRLRGRVPYWYVY